MLAFIGWVLLLGLGAFVILIVYWSSNPEVRSPEEIGNELRLVSQRSQERAATRLSTGVSEGFGHKKGDEKIKCPHCEMKGSVQTRRARQRKGISGGKAVGGLFTGGASLLLTGISRREELTKANCRNCGSTWTF